MDNERLKLLQEIGADKLFPSLLSDKELSSIKKSKKKKAKLEPSATVEEPVNRPLSDSLNLGTEFDLHAVVAEAIDPKTGKMRELVDTRSLPKAVNFYDYCFRILGSDIHAPWAIQMWLVMMSLGEVCPRCTNPKYMDYTRIDKRLSSKKLNSKNRMTFLENGVCPRCGVTKRDLLHSGELSYVNQAVYVLGQRSGKSTTAAIMASYVLHRYLTYPILSSLTESMQASTELVFIFCSLSYDKAYQVLWTPFKNIIDNAQWFRSYFALLDTYKAQYGKELYYNGAASLVFGNKNIRCYPTGPKASSLRGNTSIMTMLDELGLFPLKDPTEEVSENDTNRRADADEAYTSLLNSLATVGAAQKQLIDAGHFDAPPCLMLSVSSPISKRDKVMRLLMESKRNSFIFAKQMATWEVNPFLERDSPLIASAFSADERKALRDFGAQPTETSSPYFDPEVVSSLFTGKPNSHILTYEYDNHYVWGRVRRMNAYSGPTVLALDAGLVNNSFAVSVLGYNKETNKTETVCLLEVIAKDDNVINFEKMYSEVIFPLCQQLNVCLVVADRWNSVDHLHRIHNDMGTRRNNKSVTKVKQYSLKPRDFAALKVLMANHRVVCPHINPDLKQKIYIGEIGDYKRELIEKPVEHFYLQLLTVMDLGPSLCPGKGEGFTDDLVRAWALGVTIINKEKVIDWLEECRRYCTSSVPQGIGMVISPRGLFF